MGHTPDTCWGPNWEFADNCECERCRFHREVGKLCEALLGMTEDGRKAARWAMRKQAEAGNMSHDEILLSVLEAK